MRISGYRINYSEFGFVSKRPLQLTSFMSVVCRGGGGPSTWGSVNRRLMLAGWAAASLNSNARDCGLWVYREGSMATGYRWAPQHMLQWPWGWLSRQSGSAARNCRQEFIPTPKKCWHIKLMWENGLLFECIFFLVQQLLSKKWI